MTNTPGSKVRTQFAANILRLCLVLVACSSAIKADAYSDARKLLNDGKVDEVVTRLQQNPDSVNDAESSNLLCRAFYSVGQWDAAIKHCEQAVKLAPGNSRYHLWLGRAYGLKAERSSWFTALRLAGRTRDNFEIAVHLNADDAEARSDLAEYYIEAPGIIGGGKDKAQRLMKEIEAKDPKTAHWIKARIFEQDKHFDQAEDEYKAEVSAASNSSQTWMDLAEFYRNTKRYDEMESAIQKALAAKQKHGQLYYEAADNLQLAGRNLPFAIELMNRYLGAETVEVAPSFRGHYILGQLLEKKGDTNGAVNEYISALKLASHFKEAQQALDKLQNK